jgi:hypothetical protein
MILNILHDILIVSASRLIPANKKEFSDSNFFDVLVFNQLRQVLEVVEVQKKNVLLYVRCRTLPYAAVRCRMLAYAAVDISSDPKT